MILFSLRCAADHEFDAWFRDGATYDAQAAAGEIACPYCGDTRVGKAMMAPRLNTGRGEALDSPDLAGEARRLLDELRRMVETRFDNVGSAFVEEARRIYFGETESRPIYGEATEDQARDLEDEGIPIGRIPWIRRTDG